MPLKSPGPTQCDRWVGRGFQKQPSLLLHVPQIKRNQSQILHKHKCSVPTALHHLLQMGPMWATPVMHGTMQEQCMHACKQASWSTTFDKG